MPAVPPPLSDELGAQLAELGQRIKAYRKAARISATNAAASAGIARVTLYRIERGEPAVTMGAYLHALNALGLRFVVPPPVDREADTGKA